LQRIQNAQSDLMSWFLDYEWGMHTSSFASKLEAD
jgi:hypothetical protein